MDAPSKTPKTLLIVLDGFGEGKDYPFNAIKNAKMPFYREISKKFPRAQLLTCGEAVGLPPGVMGNSEVGHMNMGAGRIVYQELTRINRDIRNGDFARNAEILNAVKAAEKSGGRIHLFGLLSDAGVHSHTDHLKTLLEICSAKAPVTVHPFTDGRDTPPGSAEGFLKELVSLAEKFPGTVIGSLCGRYYAMDRDNRWERVELAYDAITGAIPADSATPMQALKNSYDKNVSDEFVVPVRFDSPVGRGTVEDGDVMIFFNFRGDRAREITRAFTESNFDGFKRKKTVKLAHYLCFTQYDKKLPLPVAFLPQNLQNIFPDVLAANSLSQFRIAETEKYAHVTFFFNGGREAVYPGEERYLVASPKDVATYDLKPEMSAPEVTTELAKRLSSGKYDFSLVNFANPDMVGHTGNYGAAIKALECVDHCLDKVVTAALGQDYNIFITADHGNIEEMCDNHDEPHTQHTLNPVPVHFISKQFEYKIKDGILADLAPSLLEVMGLAQPSEMTGKSLLTGKRYK